MCLLLYSLVITLSTQIFSKELCPKKQSVDLGAGTFIPESKSFLLENITYPPDTYYSDGDIVRGCVCLIKTCVNTCCPNGYAKIHNSTCHETDWVMKLDVHTDDTYVGGGDLYGLYFQHNCSGIVFSPHLSDEDTFYLQSDGKLFLDNSYFDFDDYCVSSFTNETHIPQAHICLENFEAEEIELINIYGMIISIPFLTITLIVYSLLPPNKRNVGTRCQMAYVFSLTCAYLFLVIIQLNSFSSASCKTLATLCLYAFMSSFCWMNISCIDIYWTFSGKGGYSRGFNNGRSKQFIFYCLYAYVAPLVLVSIIFGINSLDDMNLWYHPNFGENQCWLKEGYPLLLYFYGPMGLLLVCNVTLFILTAFKIRKLDRESSMVRKDDNKKHYENDKQRFNVYFKLLIALGINWTLEFASWLVDWQLGSNKVPQIWYLTDLCNALYGVFIFYLFVCKRSIWIVLKKRYYICMGQPQKARTITTRSTNYQTSDTEKTNIEESMTTTKI